MQGHFANIQTRLHVCKPLYTALQFANVFQTMSETHRYTLQPYTGPASRFHCPGCNSRERTFSRYIDTDTGQHLAEHVGKCERLNNCAYHYTPKQFFADNPDSSRQGWNISTGKRHTGPFKGKAAPPAAPASYIPKQLFTASLRPGIDIESVGRENTFIAFLISLFGEAAAAALTARYFIGTSKHWPGATVFWQIDKAGSIRAGKIMQYLIQPGHTFTGHDCKRNKANKPATYWAHKAAKLEGFNLAQCLFGEHLLRDEPNKKVGITESEKTAIIASAYLPDFIWLACGGLDQLSATRCKAIKGRSVTLFPDLKGLTRWEAKSWELAAFCDCSVSDLLERKASEADRAAGLDLADFLLRQPPPPTNSQHTCTPEKEAEEPATPSQTAAPHITDTWPEPDRTSPNTTPKRQRWTDEVVKLETFFDNITIPAGLVKLDAGSTITDIQAFISGHLATVKQQDGKGIYRPYLDRLKTLQSILTNG